MQKEVTLPGERERAEQPNKLFALWYPSSEYFSYASSQLPAPPLFVPEHHFHMFRGMGDPGHRSIALFDQRHLDFAYQYPFLWTGWQFPCYYNFLLVDLDKRGREQLDFLEDAFSEYDFLSYSSGGDDRFHFILPHNLISSSNMTSSYLSFLLHSRVDFDRSLFFPLCGMALPGARHPETGARKTLLKANSGRKFWFDDPSPEGMLKLGQNFFGVRS